MIYSRRLTQEIEKYLRGPEVIAIKGPCQSGKTTLMQGLYKKISLEKKSLFLTFEKASDLEIFEKDIESFKKLYVEKYSVIFIDEFQYAENGGQKLKYLFDTAKTKFFISGSSSLEITNKTAKYLVGRLFSFKLYPFSFAEFLFVKNKSLLELIEPISRKVNLILNFSKSALPIKEPLKAVSLKNELTKLLEDYIVFGGYPRVVLAKKKEEKQKVLQSIIETYLLRDIKDLLKLATSNELMTLARFLSLQIGNLLDYNELGNSSNLSFKNVKKHLKILEETFILNLVYPFFQNKRVELVKNPKVYFLDTGLCNQFTGNFSSLSLRSDKGAVFENHVFSQLKRKIEISRELKFWRTKSKAEVDFVIKKGEKVIPLEVKFGSGQPKIGKSLYSFINKYNPKIGFIITGNYWDRKTIGKTIVHFLPGYYL